MHNPMRRIADSTVRRLSLYLQFLEEFEGEGRETVSSAALSARGGTTSAQVRKDLSSFGSFGKRGLGYPVAELKRRLRDILGLDRTYRLAVVGAGKIGGALVQYGGFTDRGFQVVAVYDSDPARIGSAIDGRTVRNVALLERELPGLKVDIVVIATPASAAETVAQMAVRAGVAAMLNFAPVQLAVPDSVLVRNVNMALELEALSYALRNR
ncbi:MAG: redox-sensing transcriptional repressor Rex [Gemmatimonadales bacterium]